MAIDQFDAKSCGEFVDYILGTLHLGEFSPLSWPGPRGKGQFDAVCLRVSKAKSRRSARGGVDRFDARDLAMKLQCSSA